MMIDALKYGTTLSVNCGFTDQALLFAEFLANLDPSEENITLLTHSLSMNDDYVAMELLQQINTTLSQFHQARSLVCRKKYVEARAKLTGSGVGTTLIPLFQDGGDLESACNVLFGLIFIAEGNKAEASQSFAKSLKLCPLMFFMSFKKFCRLSLELSSDPEQTISIHPSEFSELVFGIHCIPSLQSAMIRLGCPPTSAEANAVELQKLFFAMATIEAGLLLFKPDFVLQIIQNDIPTPLRNTSYILENEGNALFQLRRFSPASLSLSKALKADPRRIAGAELQACALWQLRDLRKLIQLSEDMAQNAKRLNTNFKAAAAAHAVIGHLMSLRGDSHGSQQHFKLASQNDSLDPRFFTLLGHEYLAAGMVEEAEEAYLSAIKLHEREFAALMGLSHVRVKQGIFEEAYTVACRALTVNPLHDSARLQLSQMAFLLKKNEDALQLVDQTARLLDQNNFKSSSTILTGHLESHRKSTQSVISEPYNSSNNSSLVSSQPESQFELKTQTLLLKAQILIQLGEQEKAIKAVIDALRYSAVHTKAWRLLTKLSFSLQLNNNSKNNVDHNYSSDKTLSISSAISKSFGGLSSEHLSTLSNVHSTLSLLPDNHPDRHVVNALVLIYAQQQKIEEENKKKYQNFDVPSTLYNKQHQQHKKLSSKNDPSALISSQPHEISSIFDRLQSAVDVHLHSSIYATPQPSKIGLLAVSTGGDDDDDDILHSDVEGKIRSKPRQQQEERQTSHEDEGLDTPRNILLSADLFRSPQRPYPHPRLDMQLSGDGDNDHVHDDSEFATPQPRNARRRLGRQRHASPALSSAGRLPLPPPPDSFSPSQTPQPVMQHLPKDIWHPPAVDLGINQEDKRQQSTLAISHAISLSPRNSVTNQIFNSLNNTTFHMEADSTSAGGNLSPLARVRIGCSLAHQQPPANSRVQEARARIPVTSRSSPFRSPTTICASPLHLLASSPVLIPEFSLSSHPLTANNRNNQPAPPRRPFLVTPTPVRTAARHLRGLGLATPLVGGVVGGGIQTTPSIAPTATGMGDENRTPLIIPNAKIGFAANRRNGRGSNIISPDEEEAESVTMNRERFRGRLEGGGVFAGNFAMISPDTDEGGVTGSDERARQRRLRPQLATQGSDFILAPRFE